MDVREALYTTRAMRRVAPDPVPMDVQQRILDAAIRAPTGGNSQNWRFVLVDDEGLRNQIGPLYRECIDILWDTVYKDRLDAIDDAPDDPENRQFLSIRKSVDWACENFETYPLLLFAFAQGDKSGGSIFPAVWSAMLAARAEGVGSSLTSVLAFKGDEVPNLLGVPADQGWHMACCVPMGYPLGRWGVAKRNPVQDVAARNSWNGDLGFTVDEALWSAD